MNRTQPFYFGNAAMDQVRGSGWFVGQFVPAELGLRHQSDVEVKWGIHPDGEKRPQPWATDTGCLGRQRSGSRRTARSTKIGTKSRTRASAKRWVTTPNVWRT